MRVAQPHTTICPVVVQVTPFQLPVQATHRDEFHRKARLVYLDFPVKPKLNASTPVGTIQYNMKKPTWGMRKPSSEITYGTKIRIIQGCVAYPLDARQIGFSHPLLESDIDIWVPIGEVEITPSRESISYTEFTRTSLKKALELVSLELSEGFVDKINSCKTRLEALITISRMRSDNSDLFRSVESNIFKRSYDNFALVSDHITIDQCAFLPIALRRVHPGRKKVEFAQVFLTKETREGVLKGNTSCANQRMVRFNFNRPPTLIFNDLKKKSFKTRGILHRAWGGLLEDGPVYLIDPSKDQNLDASTGETSYSDDPDAAEAAALFAKEMDSELVLLSDLATKYPAPKKEKVDKQTTRIRLFYSNRRDNGTYWWKTTADLVPEVLEEQEGESKLWVKIFNGIVQEELRFTEATLPDGTVKRTTDYLMEDNQELGRLFELCQSVGAIKTGTRLFGIPERELPLVQDSDEWVNLVDLAREFLLNLSEVNTNILIARENSTTWFKLRDLCGVLEQAELWGSRISSKAKAFADLLSAGKRSFNAHGLGGDNLSRLRELFNTPIPPMPEEVKEYLSQVQEGYPLLTEMASVRYTHASAYIKLIEEREDLLERLKFYEQQKQPQPLEEAV